MIVDRIYKYLDGDRSRVPQEALDLAATIIKGSLNRNMGAAREKSARLPSPSSKWGCQRRMFWDADPSIERERVTARSLVAFTLGDMLEQAGVIMARQALGPAVVSPDIDTGAQRTFSVDVGGYPITGHIDMEIYDEILGTCPVDWKSMAAWGFEDFVAASTDPDHKWWDEQRDGYVAQVRWYMHGTGAKRGYLCGICKNTGHMAEVEIREDKAELERLARIHIETNEAIRLNVLPERPDWAAQPVEFSRRRLPDGSNGAGLELDTKATPGFSWACGYCPYTTKCFPGFSVVAMQRPVYRKPL